MKTKAYGFTTTPNDAFARRIAEEAKPKDQFLLATTRNVATGTQSLTVFVREAVIPKLEQPFTLAGKPLQSNWGRLLRRSGFRVRSQVVEDGEKATNIALGEIQRIKNFLHGRVVRVQVTSV